MSIGPALTHTLYINADGVTLTHGSEDATANTTHDVAQATTFAPWLAGDAARATRIANLVTEVRTTLAAYDVSVVATRPATGSYDMVVLTDSPASTVAGAPAGGIVTSVCNVTPSVVSILFGPTYAAFTTAQAQDTLANYAIALFANEAGIPWSTKPADCMCFADGACTPPNAPCTIGGAGTAIDSHVGCGLSGPTMDERALFLSAFGAHP